MKSSGFNLLLLTIGIVFLTTPAVFAQEGGTQDNLLPEIDPQDIEIRSEFTARFPGLRRQPILGFNPEPRIYQVDPNRMPFMETDEEVVANLQITDLSRPAAPGYQNLNYPADARLFGRLGVGSFVSPEAEIWGINKFSKNSYASGKLNYHSSDGHLASENSSFRYFDMDADYATKINQNTSFKVKGGFENSFNRMFRLDNINTIPLDIPEGPRKKYDGYNLGVNLNHYKNSVAGWNADAGFRWYEMEMSAGEIGGTAGEAVFHTSARKEWAGSRLQETFAVNASGRGGSYDLSERSGSQSWMTVRAVGEYHRLLNYSTQLDGELGVVYTSNEFEDKVYPALSLKAKQWVQDQLTVSASLNASPRLNTIEQLNQLNRFLNHQIPLRHTYTIEGTCEISFTYYQGSTLFARLSYMNAQNYAYFQRDQISYGVPGPTSSESYYTIGYGDANRIKGEMGATHQLVPEKFWINAGAYVQQPKLSGGTDIPYEERWGVTSGAAAKLFQKLRLEAWADYVSSRNTLSSTTLDGFLLLGGQIDIQITDRIGVYARMQNILSQEYEIWDGYQERPFQAYGGVTVKLN